MTSGAKDPTAVHISSSRLEVKVHKAYHEEYQMSRTNDDGSSDAQLADKSHELSSDDNVDGRV